MCPTCGKTYTSKGSLSIHMKIHMREQGLSQDQRPRAKTSLYHYCEVCGKKCQSPYLLKGHILRMHSQGPFPCRKCGEQFSTQNKMKLHVLKEHKKKPQLQCEHCGYETYLPSSLRVHQTTHLEPTFKCSHCENMFKTKKGCEAHEREHTGERPFECKVCGKGFKASSTLTTHTKHVHKILTPKMTPIVARTRKR